MDPIASDGSYPVTTHPACGVRDYPVLVIEQNHEATISKDFINLSLKRQQFFFRHELSFRYENISRDEKGSM
ncbi:hypothetical protein GCM10010989_12960 [Croceicoccus pelagius]|uniref:Uncharacterized protein n=1 Tax=Croceicoccus pelagius TaxID=1703341 RepID=A0A916YCQ1_9SPHN|nr:hypothetical protein GCM10010989_12960 [Croceicoccus pelagius]